MERKHAAIILIVVLIIGIFGTAYRFNWFSLCGSDTYYVYNEPSNGGTIYVNGNAVSNGYSTAFLCGSDVSLQASPSSGYSFVTWGNEGPATLSSYTSPSTTLTDSSGGDVLEIYANYYSGSCPAPSGSSSSVSLTYSISDLTVSFIACPTGGTAPFTYSWTFGDGGTSTSQDPTHTYSSAGTYEVEVSQYDSQGASGGFTAQAIYLTVPGATTTSTSTTVTTTSTSTAPLSVSISAAPSSGDAPLSTTFTSVVSGGIAPYIYSWTFGDSSASTLADPSHTYQSAATYLAQLKVTDSAGATASNSFTVVANSLSSSTTTYTTTTITTTSTSTGITTITSGSSTFTSTYTSVITSQECLILSNVPQCHLPNTPPGLPIAWATSNMSVGAREITGQIQIAPSISVGNIQSTSTISNIAFSSNYSAMQVEFASSGPVTLSFQAPRQPSAVWADAQQITTWNYSNGVLTVNADPSAITVFFTSGSSSNPVTAFLEANWILLAIIAVVASAVAGASARKR